jgi:hypothetical protein
MDMQKKKEEFLKIAGYKEALEFHKVQEAVNKQVLEEWESVEQLLAEKDKEFRNNVIRLFYIKDFPLQTPRGHEKWLKDFIAKFGLDKAMRDIEDLSWEEIKEMHFNSPITNN